jgi:sulfite reductase alpha subunit-like flavoprotein
MLDGLLVTYGSQNGTSQDYAENLYLEATMKGIRTRIMTLNELLQAALDSPTHSVEFSCKGETYSHINIQYR